MDIWRWVHDAQRELHDQGHSRLADQLTHLASLVVDEEHEKVDALVPELLSLAKKQPNKWIELYLRHWHLQSLVLNRQQVKDALPEAIALLDFSHQEDTKGCPQSVCAVQDLAHCYASQDGLGYAEERLEVAKEGLEKITPEWPCFGCISSEYVNALIDQQKFDQALEFVSHYKEEHAKFDSDDDSDLALSEVKALINLKRYDEALHIINTVQSPHSGDHFVNRKQGYKSYLLALKGAFAESRALLQPFSIIERTTSLGEPWLNTIMILAEADEIYNDWKLQDNVRTLGLKHLDQGCYRIAFDTFAIQARLAILRNQKNSALAALDLMKQAAQQLAKDCGAQAQQNALAEQINTLAEAPKINFDDSAAALEQLDEDPIERLAQLKQGLTQWPDNQSWMMALSECFYQLDQTEEQHAALKGFLESYPNSPDIILEYGFMGGETPFIAALMEQSITNEAQTNALWVIANHANQSDEHELALDTLDQLFELAPESFNALRLAQRIAQATEDYQRALEYNERLLALEPDNTNHYWDTILYTTLLGDWTRVRECAAKLELDIDEGEGEIDEEWNVIRIQLDEDTQVKALRTGPVTAEILEVADADDECHVGAKAVFDPYPLNQLDQEDENGHRHDKEGNYTYLYPVIRIVRPGSRRTHVLDGVLPQDELYEEFSNALRERNIRLSRRSGPEYTLYTNKGEHTGLYAYMYIDEAQSDAFVHEQLTQLCEKLEHPILWPVLAEKAGDQAAAEKMHQQAEKYDIIFD